MSTPQERPALGRAGCDGVRPALGGPRVSVMGEHHPSEGDSVVSFEVFSTGHVLEGTHRLLAEVSDKVPPVLAAEDDYDLLAACQAGKLAHDLEAVAQAIHGEYVDGRIGVSLPASRARRLGTGSAARADGGPLACAPCV